MGGGGGVSSIKKSGNCSVSCSGVKCASDFFFFSEEKPKFTRAPVSSIAEPGKPVTLSAQIENADEVKWLKNEKEIRSSRDVKIEKDKDDKTLHLLKIPNFSPDHVGLYTCQALNDTGVMKGSAFLGEKGLHLLFSLVEITLEKCNRGSLPLVLKNRNLTLKSEKTFWTS